MNDTDIVDALAADCPTKASYSRFCDGPADYDGEECYFCETKHDEDYTRPEEHKPDCLYRIACERKAARGR